MSDSEPKIHVSTSDGWEHFLSEQPAPYEITGKYLFFSADREKLVDIARGEITNGGFHSAKVRLPESKVGGDYALCLYFADDRRKSSLARKYRHSPGVSYRYWKADADTYAGRYSPEFLEQLSEGEPER